MLIVFYLLEYRSLDIRKSLLLCLGPKDFHVNSIFGQAKVGSFWTSYWSTQKFIIQNNEKASSCINQLAFGIHAIATINVIFNRVTVVQPMYDDPRDNCKDRCLTKVVYHHRNHRKMTLGSQSPRQHVGFNFSKNCRTENWEL